MRRWFDLHVYKANWGSRRLMMRLPQRLMQPRLADRFLRAVEDATLATDGDNLILDIAPNDLERYDDDYADDGSRWLARLAPLRADLLGGDLRILYLLWLMAVESEAVDPTEPEPLPGLGPMNAALDAFVEFVRIDDDLVHAAAERPVAMVEMDSDATRRILSQLSDDAKTEWLTRLASGDPHAAAELRLLVRERLNADASATDATVPPRTAGELLARAKAIRAARLKREAAQEERALAKQLAPLRQRGEAVWHEVESEIALRNPAGYQKACTLLRDLKMLAEYDGASADFSRRLDSIRERHSRKHRFIVRLEKLT